MSPSRAAGIILAGGQSSRMGQDKALLPLLGKPLIAYAADLLNAAALPVVIAGSRPDLAAFGRIIPDSEPGHGPLHGICRVFAAVDTELAVIVTVDTPLMPPGLITCLVDYAVLTAAPVVLASINGFAQTFPAVVRRSALSALEHELTSGSGSCFAAFRTAAAAGQQPLTTIAAETVVQCGRIQHYAGLPPCFWFLNINTPADLKRAVRLKSLHIA